MELKFSTIMFISSLISCNGDFFNTESKRNVDSCFCQLKGVLDDCSCSVDTLDHFNNVKIYPRLQSLLVNDYFRFYKVNLKKPCPFWSDDSRCAIKHCHVETCQDDDIPKGLKSYWKNSDVSSKNDVLRKHVPDDCDDHDETLGYLNTTISASAFEDFALWKLHDDSLDNFCLSDNEYDGEAQYVDLLLNPERYTGYKGVSAHHIWRSIYMENCFRLKKSLTAPILTETLNDMCLEKRVFYRVISGLHASINIHLCSKYLLSEKNDLGFIESGGKWGPNLEEFRQRFDPERTKGEGPQWLKNLYFVYLLELRALAKAAPYLSKELYYTGNETKDTDVRTAVNDLLVVIKLFPEHFNESIMFNGGYQARKLKEEFKQHFRNISHIMDCVGCDKCKLWGKLQIQGLGTALKILFSGKFDQIEKGHSEVIVPMKSKFYLERSEIVSLLNAFGRLSTSIYELEDFRRMTQLLK